MPGKAEVARGLSGGVKSGVATMCYRSHRGVWLANLEKNCSRKTLSNNYANWKTHPNNPMATD